MRCWRSSPLWRLAVLLALAGAAAGCKFDKAGLGTLPFDTGLPTPDRGVDAAADARRDAPVPPDLGPPADLLPVDLQLPDFTPLPDAFVCPPECVNACGNGICELDCDAGPCTCPPGLPCRAICDDDECTQTVDCSKATACQVLCAPKGGNACHGDVICGSGPCFVSCGYNSCRRQVDCASASSCTVDCLDNSCHGDVRCGSGDCTVRCGTYSCHQRVSCAAAKACTIECAAALGLLGGCHGDVTCGSGPCHVKCGFDSCRKQVDCSSATTCDIDCGSLLTNACYGNVTCGSGMCKVRCGLNACRTKVDCRSACGCAAGCTSSFGCSPSVFQCPAKCDNDCDLQDGCDCP